MPRTQILTSESVAEGHPDKIADQISDSVVDAALAQDPASRVACETMVKTGMVVLAGEIRTNAHIEFERLVRDRVCAIGYDDPLYGFDGETCAVLVALGQQSADIAMGVDESGNKDLGAGDQGMMFGYATRETDALLPAPITLAHRLMRRHAEVRRAGTLDWLRPDAKSQVTVRYEDGMPAGIDAVVLSAQHREDVGRGELEAGVMEEIIRPVLPEEWLDDSTRYHINPTGRFVVGGPVGDCGLTGRKIIVDTYGGLARHGGGAFSGKDPSKVDRSAAYRLPVRGEERGRGGARGALRGAGRVRHRHIGAGLGGRRDVRHRPRRRGAARLPRPRALRPAAGRHHRDARPRAANLPANRRLRALRAR